MVFPEPKSRSSELNLKLDRATLRDLARGVAGHPADDPKRQQPTLTAQEKMGQDIAKSARGNCMKGEYPGGGMGLLSLPFLIAAELRQRCAD